MSNLSRTLHHVALAGFMQFNKKFAGKIFFFICVKSKESLRALTVVHLCDVKLSRHIHLSCKLNNRCQPKTGVPLRINVFDSVARNWQGEDHKLVFWISSQVFDTSCVFHFWVRTHSLEIVLDSVLFYLRLLWTLFKVAWHELLCDRFNVLLWNLLLDFSLDFWHLYQIFWNNINS